MPKPKALPVEKLSALTLLAGKHATRDDGVCAMEAVAWLAGEKHSDHPSCACPVIGAFIRSWNDALPADADRDRLLKPLLPQLLNTRAAPEVELRRSWMALDWLIRVYAPAWLDLPGDECAESAAELRALPEITPTLNFDAVSVVVARAKARGAAAWAAAWDAAWAAARAATWDAARLRLAPVVEALQTSAADLAIRMCEAAE